MFATGTLRNTLTGHTDWINSVAFSLDGNTIASGSADDAVRLWDVHTGNTRNTLTGHTSMVISVAFSPDGNTIASGSADDAVRLWDVHTGSLRNTLTGHTDLVRSVAFSPDGNTIASRSPEDAVRLWDVHTGTLLRTLTEHTDWISSMAFSPVGNTIATASSNGTVLLWGLTPGESSKTAADVNGDGSVNIQDLVLVASRLGQAGENKADVNGDGVVNIQDLVLVAGELGAAAAAPSAWHHTSMGIPTRATVAQWLTQAHGLLLTDARSQRGILLLERLLATLVPTETALLPNYPNPFNPETWIPYHLSKPADVTLTIYSVDGKVVRTLALGHQVAGYYQSKSRAAYWDGRNNVGERVASGIYFYTLTVGDFAATKKLLIRK